MENYLSLLGVLIVILGFAFKLDSILIVMVALVVTALTGGLGIQGMLELLGTSFVELLDLFVRSFYLWHWEPSNQKD